MTVAGQNQQQQQRPGSQPQQNQYNPLQQQNPQQQTNAQATIAALQNLLAGVQHQQQPQTGAAGGPGAPFAMPQPTSSGSLDLSNIKPTGSGTVSLQDAIARAKSFASERGVQPSTYRQHDQGIFARVFLRCLYSPYSKPTLLPLKMSIY